jgi:hypothetical protein
MIALANTNRLDVVRADTRLVVEQLHSPRSRYRHVEPGAHWAADNGAFSNFNAEAFQRMLRRLTPHRERCRFVAVPDVVGSAILTLELWGDRRALWPELAGWPLAFVAQDGCEGRIPWGSMRALFVGGAGDWKESDECERVVRAAKIRGLWVHVGRLNTPERLARFHALGAGQAGRLALGLLGFLLARAVVLRATRPAATVTGPPCA